MTFQRARTEDQINNRIIEIVKAASDILDSVGYDDLTFTKISELTKFTRPNIYKYFKTKDEILLIIIENEFKLFVDSLISSFKLNRIYSIKESAEILTDRLIDHKRLIELYSVLSLIEKNVSLESLASFKSKLHKEQTRLLQLLAQLFPKASEESINELFYFQLTLAFGFYPSTKLECIQKEALELAGITYNPPNFRESYMKAIYQLMYCLENEIKI